MKKRNFIILGAKGSSGGDTPTPDTPTTKLEQKYEGATVIRVNIPTDNYEFAINLCNNNTATYNVDWGDNILENSLTTDEQHHTYAKAGIYDINIYNLSGNISLGGYNDNIPFLFNNSNNDIWSFKYIETKDNLIVSDVLIGNKIFSISNNTFYNCTNLQSVVIPEGVTSIDYNAFYGCTNLQSVVIPEGVTTIGSQSFQYCYSLQSVVIPEGVTSIGSQSFQYCTSLQSVVIPEGVTSIGSSAFSNCPSLQSVEIPNSVTYIDYNAFNGCTNLQSVVIPEGVTFIGDSAFSNCPSLQSVVIPEGVTSIRDYTFNNCSSLQSVVIPEGVTSIGSLSFQYCTSLQSVVIPEGVTSIGNYAFNSCSSLQSIVIPEGVTSIGNYAFQDCTSLQSVVIPEGVTSIGSSAFYDCTYLQSITINAMTAPTIQSTTFSKNSSSSFKYTKRYLYVPKGATGYDEGNWKTYLIDKGWELRYIEDKPEKKPTTLKLKTVNNFLHKLNAIGGANLVDYELVNDEYIYHFDDKIEEIVLYTFYNKKLKEIELPEGVTSIKTGAFSDCSSLQSVVIPEGVTKISDNTFYGCTSLQSVVIPEGVTSIGSQSFQYCYSLQSVVIPEGVTSIGNAVFYECTSLQSVVIPEGVTSIGSNAFSYCYYLQSITVNALTAPKIQRETFYSVGSNVPSGTPKILRVPEGATGYDTGNWKTYLIDKGYTLEYIGIEEPNDNEDILVIENVDEVEGTVKMNNPNNIVIQYSTDGEYFDLYIPATEIPIYPNEKVYFKWSDVIGKYNLLNFNSIVNSSVKYKVYGELKQGNNEYAYYNMFRNQTNLIDASELQLTASVLNKACYSYMFYGCSSLTTTPQLPSIELADICYSYMFSGCSSLVQPPALPSTILQSSCYFHMFQNCTSLVTAPELFATELFGDDMLNGCYGNMFSGCTSLNYVKHHIVNWNTTSANNWLKDVAPSGTMYCPLNSTIPSDNASGLPSGWIRVNIE